MVHYFRIEGPVQSGRNLSVCTGSGVGRKGSSRRAGGCTTGWCPRLFTSGWRGKGGGGRISLPSYGLLFYLQMDSPCPMCACVWLPTAASLCPQGGMLGLQKVAVAGEAGPVAKSPWVLGQWARTTIPLCSSCPSSQLGVRGRNEGSCCVGWSDSCPAHLSCTHTPPREGLSIPLTSAAVFQPWEPSQSPLSDHT